MNRSEYLYKLKHDKEFFRKVYKETLYKHGPFYGQDQIQQSSVQERGTLHDAPKISGTSKGNRPLAEVSIDPS